MSKAERLSSLDRAAENFTTPTPQFLTGGGDMGARMRGHDWSRSPLGPVETWPQPLRTATAMMLNTQQPMFIAWGEGLGFIYNDAYAPILGERHPAALGRPFADIWEDIWHDVGPLAETAVGGTPVWQEDLPLLMHRHGYPEQTYFTFTYSPLRGDAGERAGMFCTCIETTGRVVAERRLRESAEALAASEDRYRRQGERLFSLFEEAPGFVAVLEGPDHVFTLANAAYRQLVGHRDIIGLGVREALPELHDDSFFELLDNVFRTGETYVGRALQARLQRQPGAPPEERFVDFVYQAIRADDGAITGVFVQGSDVTERQVFVEKQQLLLDELNHRVKNNLATVQSLATQTARVSPDLPSFLRDFQGRLVALSRTHDILTSNAWMGALLEDVVRKEMAAFSGRVDLDGPPAMLSSSYALAIGLITHELGTNAAKYGALSGKHGQVLVSWRTSPTGLVLEWVERGGPPVAAPVRRGFGTRLIQKLANGELSGRAVVDYAPEGLRFQLTVSLPQA